jgi:hypothetical protein
LAAEGADLADEHTNTGVSHYVTFDGASAVEVFGKVLAWLAPRDGALTVVTTSWNCYSEDRPFGLTLYYEIV